MEFIIIVDVHMQFAYWDAWDPAQPGDWDVDMIYYLDVLVSWEGIFLTDCALRTPHSVDTDQASSVH